MDSKETIPQLHIVIKREVPTGSGELRYCWRITMKAPDASGSRKLGYRASGFMVEKGDQIEFSYESEPQVHDEMRPVWTTMNLTDRFDIRKQLERLARRALVELKTAGGNIFEREIK